MKNLIIKALMMLTLLLVAKSLGAQNQKLTLSTDIASVYEYTPTYSDGIYLDINTMEMYSLVDAQDTYYNIGVIDIEATDGYWMAGNYYRAVIDEFGAEMFFVTNFNVATISVEGEFVLGLFYEKIPVGWFKDDGYGFSELIYWDGVNYRL
jgi:hypothetical protein